MGCGASKSEARRDEGKSGGRKKRSGDKGSGVDGPSSRHAKDAAKRGSLEFRGRVGSLDEREAGNGMPPPPSAATKPLTSAELRERAAKAAEERAKNPASSGGGQGIGKRLSANMTETGKIKWSVA